MHHHAPPMPVEPAVAPVPVLEQESVLDLSRRRSPDLVRPTNASSDGGGQGADNTQPVPNDTTNQST